MAQILKTFYICPFMCQVIAATNDFQISWNPFLYNVLKRAIWMGKFQVESNSVWTSWRGLNILCRYKRVLL